MHRERAEEGLLAAIAALSLAALLQAGLGARLGIAAGMAIALVLLLVLRSADWHAGGATPFDGILLAGAAASVAHLASMSLLVETMLSEALLAATAAFYAGMAILLARHRGWLFRENDG